MHNSAEVQMPQSLLVGGGKGGGRGLTSAGGLHTNLARYQ